MKESRELPKPKGVMIIREHVMPTREIFHLLAQVSHDTYVKQRHESKGDPVESIPKKVSEEDETRAKAAWWALLDAKPQTREEAVAVVAESSHQVWLGGQKSEEGLEPAPNDHDKERAEHFIKALEDAKIIEFR